MGRPLPPLRTNISTSASDLPANMAYNNEDSFGRQTDNFGSSNTTSGLGSNTRDTDNFGRSDDLTSGGYGSTGNTTGGYGSDNYGSSGTTGGIGSDYNAART